MIPDRYIDGHVERLVSELRPGDRVDLEGDIFADPNWSEDGLDSDHPEFRFEYEVVTAVEFEPHDIDPCIRVDFESGFSCGFPPDHWVDVDGEQVR